MNMVFQMLMNNLQRKNPQAYQFVNQAMNNNGDPNAILHQIMGNATPEQKQALIQKAQNYGVPNNYLAQIQNIKPNNKS